MLRLKRSLPQPTWTATDRCTREERLETVENAAPPCGLWLEVENGADGDWADQLSRVCARDDNMKQARKRSDS